MFVILSFRNLARHMFFLFLLTCCTRSADLYAYVIYLAYARCTYICMAVTVAKPSVTLGQIHAY